MPLNLLLILGAGAVVVVFGTYGPVHELLTVGFLVAAVAIMIRAAPEGTKPTDPIDELEAERILTISAYAGALAVAAVALLVAFLWPAVALAVIGITALWVVGWWPRGVRTNTLTSKIAIRSDPAAVFAFVSDFENEPKYMAMVEQVEKLTPGPIGAGTQFRTRVRLPASLGMETVMVAVEEIVDFKPDHLFTARVASGMHYNFDVLTFDPISDGMLVTHRFDFLYSYATAVLATTLIFGASSNRILRANRAANWARAKQILESDGQATP
jgi:hypothetical protein